MTAPALIPVVWLSLEDSVPATGYWDNGIIRALLEHEIWRPVDNYRFKHFYNYRGLEGQEGAVVIIPGRNQAHQIDRVNQLIKPLQWVLIVITGDEENAFPDDKLKHPNMKKWIMTPDPAKHGEDVFKLGTGWPGNAPSELAKHKKLSDFRPLDYFFAGQITHERRKELKTQLDVVLEFKHVNNLIGETAYSKSFTAGLPHPTYYRKMASAKVVPAPSGPQSPDSFRLFEALEAGAIPIADTRTPNRDFGPDFWEYFFGERPPFPTLSSYDQLQGYMIDSVKSWPELGNQVFAWWQGYKRKMAYRLHEDLQDLGVTHVSNRHINDKITVIIPSSPIASHPSTEMIEKTIEEIRSQLPDCEIIITLDGVRKEQEPYRARYERYKQRLLWLCNFQWHNVLPIVHEEHLHQAEMAKRVLPLIKTKVLLYVEHDTPITSDRTFQWQSLIECVESGTANFIRLHHEALILPEHKHLMLGEAERHNQAWLTKTVQWSQRPHLASVAFYRKFLNDYFKPNSRTMIEDRMHGVVEADVSNSGNMAWNNWRLWVYTPKGEDIKRSYHLDGRGSDPKYEEGFDW